MRLSKAEAAKNRARIVSEGARLLRDRGIEGVGVDAVAEAAGLTHGGVYSHFESKDALAAAAVGYALQASMTEWLGLIEGLEPQVAFGQLAKAYVSRTHRDNPGAGCAIAALGVEALRGNDVLRAVLAQGTVDFIAILETVSSKASGDDKRKDAIVHAAMMIGAVVMARAANSDQKLSAEILKAVRAELTG